MCRLRRIAVVAAYSHLSQGYLTPSCLLSICRFRLLAVVAEPFKVIVSSNNVVKRFRFYHWYNLTNANIVKRYFIPSFLKSLIFIILACSR